MVTSAQLRATPPPRSPARQRLAEAQERLAEASAVADRVAEAQAKLGDQLFDDLQPAVATAREALEDARAAAPEALVAATLGEPVDLDALSAADAEKRLADAERKLAEARQARSLLADEATARQHALDMAVRAVDAAVSAVVSSDPTRAALLAEFNLCARRALRCVMALRTSGMVVQGTVAHGLMFRISDAPTTIDKMGTAFVPDPAWLAALAALKSDADQPLPGLPPAEDDHAVGGAAAAAA